MYSISNAASRAATPLQIGGNDHLVLLTTTGEFKTYIHCTVHEGAFYQLFVQLSSATTFEPISGNIDVPLGKY